MAAVAVAVVMPAVAAAVSGVRGLGVSPRLRGSSRRETDMRRTALEAPAPAGGGVCLRGQEPTLLCGLAGGCGGLMQSGRAPLAVSVRRVVQEDLH